MAQMGKPSGRGADAELPQLSETRHITFSKEALTYALTSYLAASKQPLPPGMLQSCEIAAKPDISVTLGILDAISGMLEKAKIPAETVGAAMIRYCRLVNVPLPRTAEKSLVSAGDNLILTVHVRSEQTKLFEIKGRD
ncbi:hypothetical protein ACFPL7_24000 [Dongia soli]|uniref:Uncharacterized protein n=1 Tax=Dongia soli TaxID=600628 RepID=A0ABU5EHL6_9PROT|nr:hypothetical protein [Dongia soli]MDY0885367.1 hypothetical protein [Dongia soli]